MTITFYGYTFQNIPLTSVTKGLALQPRLNRFRLLPVRSPLLRESLLISFPLGT